MTALTVHVPGVPQPQGSMRHFGPGRPLESSNKATLMPWRSAVIAHVQQAMAGHTAYPIDGPVKVEVTFHLPRPPSAPRWRLWPDRRPDLDKLCRALLDALEQAGVVTQDARVVVLHASKDYGTPGMSLRLSALAVPARRAS